MLGEACGHDQAEDGHRDKASLVFEVSSPRHPTTLCLSWAPDDRVTPSPITIVRKTYDQYLPLIHVRKSYVPC